MSNAQQARVPQGVITGGQFAPEQRQETSVRLFDRDGGTYFNPAPSKTAKHCIEFWGNVQIPDEIIDQVKVAHHRDRVKHVDEIMENWMGQWREEWPEKNPKPSRKKDVADWEQRYRDEHETYRLHVLPQAETERAGQLGRYSAPQVIRAWKMVQHIPDGVRWPEERQAVLDHEVELYEGNLTVGQIYSKFRLDRISDATDRIYHADESDRLLEALQQVDRRLAGVHQEIAMQNQASGGY